MFLWHLTDDMSLLENSNRHRCERIEKIVHEKASKVNDVIRIIMAKLYEWNSVCF